MGQRSRPTDRWLRVSPGGWCAANILDGRGCQVAGSQKRWRGCGEHRQQASAPSVDNATLLQSASFNTLPVVSQPGHAGGLRLGAAMARPGGYWLREWAALLL